MSKNTWNNLQIVGKLKKNEWALSKMKCLKNTLNDFKSVRKVIKSIE